MKFDELKVGDEFEYSQIIGDTAFNVNRYRAMKIPKISCFNIVRLRSGYHNWRLAFCKDYQLVTLISEPPSEAANDPKETK